MILISRMSAGVTATNTTEYTKQLGLFSKSRPKTPAVAGRNIFTRPKRAFSAKQRLSVERDDTEDNKHHKLFEKFNIQSIKVRYL